MKLDSLLWTPLNAINPDSKVAAEFFDPYQASHDLMIGVSSSGLYWHVSQFCPENETESEVCSDAERSRLNAGSTIR